MHSKNAIFRYFLKKRLTIEVYSYIIDIVPNSFEKVLSAVRQAGTKWSASAGASKLYVKLHKPDVLHKKDDKNGF